MKAIVEIEIHKHIYIKKEISVWDMNILKCLPDIKLEQQKFGYSESAI